MSIKSAHRPRKRFGQNFLCDPNVIQNIINAFALLPEDKVIEIGPGLGALTQPLLKQVKHLDVIEIDRDLAHQLKINVGETSALTIYPEDILKFDLNTIANQYPPLTKFRIIGNLPYNISTPLLFHLLKFSHLIEDMFFMLQKEVVARLSGQPHHKDYGRLSIMAQYHFTVKPLFIVPPSAFHPSPKVQSQVVQLIPHRKSPYAATNLALLQNITRTAFNQRRKTLLNALKPYLELEEFIHLNINPKLRPEALSIEDFVNISHYIEQRGYLEKGGNP